MKDAAARSTWRWSTRLKLRRAGWRSGRNVWEQVRLPEGIPLFPIAQQVLAEFGNLKVKVDGQVILDPSLGNEIKDKLKNEETTLGRRLYPLGVVDGGDYMWLVIDDTGRVYTFTDILESFAPSFDEAIEFLVRGWMTRQEWKAKGPGSND